MVLKIKCIECGKEFTKSFPDAEISRIIQGESPMKVFPNLSIDDRELFFMSHICPECWDKIFDKEEEFDTMLEQHYELQSEIECGK